MKINAHSFLFIILRIIFYDQFNQVNKGILYKITISVKINEEKWVN